MKDAAMVITTVNHPTPAVRQTVEGLPGFNIIIVGDNKTPAGWNVPGTRFLSIAEQKVSNLNLARELPDNHYCRKNLGYLEAMITGAERIAETDDDNHPDGWDPAGVAEQLSADMARTSGWVNVYARFTDRKIWPRGIPLNNVRSATIEVEPSVYARIGVHQYLAAGDPDVDAIYRLTEGATDHSFTPGTLILDAGAWVPFNSQSTVWFPSAYMYMYLPSFVSFRMTDIWRSFIAQVCMWSDGTRLAYHAPGVFQERNDHDLMIDFSQEVVGYLRNQEIVDTLTQVPLSGSPARKLRACYEALLQIGVVEARELHLVDAWIADVEGALSKR